MGRVIIATDTVNEDRCANQDTLTRSDWWLSFLHPPEEKNGPEGSNQAEATSHCKIHSIHNTILFFFFFSIIKDVIKLLKGSFKNTAQHKHVFSAVFSQSIIMRRFRLQNYSMRPNWLESLIRADEKGRLIVKRFFFAKSDYLAFWLFS